jgi:protein phosphatase
MKPLKIPELCLVVLVGTTGSGKSTFAARHFLPTEVVSSDFCRGLVSDDENDQSATTSAFEVLHLIVGKRLEAGRLSVVDATSVQVESRRALIELAKQHHALAVAVVLDLPAALCAVRNESRPDRQFGPHVLRNQRTQLQRSMKGLRREGFHRVYVLSGEDEIAVASFERERLWNDRRDDHGPFDIIGDVHGCHTELVELLVSCGYEVDREGTTASHPGGRRALFLGDLVDRGPASPAVLRLVMAMVGSSNALCVPGNHEVKLLRALRGRTVSTAHGLAITLEQLSAEPPDFPGEVAKFIDGLIGHYVLDDGRLVIAHAGLPANMHGRASGAVRSFALYGDTTGETDEYGLPVRYPWAEDYRGDAIVVYGHTPVPEAVWLNRTICIDTGCVFGGRLTALRYPESEIVSVAAHEQYYEPAKPLDAGRAEGPDREPTDLDLEDVVGKRVIETHLCGTVTIREENAVAALEVMSRFAVDPRWLVYLPPTMSPTATSSREGLLEHPHEAFAAYRQLVSGAWSARRSTWALGRSSSPARTPLWSSGALPSTPPFRVVFTRERAVLFSAIRPPRQTLSTRCAQPSARLGCVRSSTLTGSFSTASFFPGPPRPNSCCEASTLRWARPARAPLEPRSSSSRPRVPAASRSARSPRTCRDVPAWSRTSSPPLGGTAGRSRASAT